MGPPPNQIVSGPALLASAPLALVQLPLLGPLSADPVVPLHGLLRLLRDAVHRLGQLVRAPMEWSEDGEETEVRRT